jgi:molybdopterin-guanine dinucleotide biosynthesis protein A
MTIDQLFISPAHNFFGHHGQPAGEAPALAVDAIECVAGRGLRGDRFFDHAPDHKGQITLFAAEIFEELQKTFALPEAQPAALRRNALVRGADLNALIGVEFTVQGVRLIGVEECRPCYWMDRVLAPGTEHWLRGRGGLRCRILTDGVIRCESHLRMRWEGAVLAGGRSRRMGRDKAALVVAGEPLWQRQLRVLREAGAARASLVRAIDQTVFNDSAPALRDQMHGIGPLGGLHAALSASGEPFVGVLAIDLPGIEAAWFQMLRSRCTPGIGVIARSGDRFEPLAALYPRDALALVERQIAASDFRLQSLVAQLVAAGQLRVIELSAEQQARFANWNCPADLPKIAC